MNISRRTILGYGGASLFGSGLLSPWCSVSLAAEKSQDDFDDYKAIVYLLFSGGMDSFNLLVPYDANEYERYADIRTDLAIQREDLLPLDTTYTRTVLLRYRPLHQKFVIFSTMEIWRF